MGLKGRQLCFTKKGELLVVLHRELCRPVSWTDTDWMFYLRHANRVYKLAQDPVWWEYHWPLIKAGTNIAIAKEESRCELRSSHTLISLADDILISVFNEDNRYEPYDRRLLCGFLRFPYGWWAENIDTLSEEIQSMAASHRKHKRESHEQLT